MPEQKTRSVVYDHDQNTHTIEGARAALPALLGDLRPRSLLDVGCGTGTWLRAALDFGIPDVCGIDGVQVSRQALHVPEHLVRVFDLREDWPLERRFDIVLCLEVAEHLDETIAQRFISRLTSHGDTIFFSAANPWQHGQHHVNCQWPVYWQALFNRFGFACRDSLRWKIWDNTLIEPWYRQNLFLAEKAESVAGQEPRIPGLIHPDFMPAACEYWRRSHEGLIVAGVSWMDRKCRNLFR